MKTIEKNRKKGLAAVVLAAGKGTRMRSSVAKILHPLCGLPLGAWPIEAARAAGAKPIVVVVGHQAEEAGLALSKAAPDARLSFAVQEEQLGTGHAVMCARREIEASKAGRVLILCGDVPCLTGSTLSRLARAGEKADIALLTFEPAEPGRYGRIVRDERGRVTGIVEAADATAAQKKIREVNAGIYCMGTGFLLRALDGLTDDNAQGELYLTDLVELASKEGGKVTAVSAEEEEVQGVNDRVDLARAAKMLRARINDKLMRGGVSFEDPSATYVDAGVKIGADSMIAAGAHLIGETRLGTGVEIGPCAVVQNSHLQAGAVIKAHSVLDSATVEAGASVGPFARLRPGTVIGRKASVGNFVEVKNARLGEGAKSGHLTYLGDADIGPKANIGAGTITCNYDGKDKFRTKIGRGCFIGSNSALVAPVSIGKNGYVAAGSTITQDIPEGALGVARGRQRNIEGWTSRTKAKKISRPTPGPSRPARRKRRRS